MVENITEEVKSSLLQMDEALSSDEEEDIKEEEHEKFINHLTFLKDLPLNVHTVEELIVCLPGTPQALIKIALYGHLREIGEAKTQYHSGNKTVTTLKVYRGDTISQ